MPDTALMQFLFYMKANVYLYNFNLYKSLRGYLQAVAEEAVSAYIARYRRCCERAQKWYLLLLKYEATRDIQILQRVRDEIPVAYQEESDALCGFYSASHAWYCEHVRLIP